MSENYEYVIQLCRNIQIICGFLFLSCFLAAAVLFFKLQMAAVFHELRSYKPPKSSVYTPEIASVATDRHQADACASKNMDTAHMQTLSIRTQADAGFVMQRSIVLVHDDEMTEVSHLLASDT